jgi:hypothetical protein
VATNNALNLGLSGSTGTGSFVGSSAPTIVNGIWQSPSINSPSGTVLTVSSTGTPVNQFVMTASPTTAAPVLSAAGTDTNVLLQINGKGTSGLGLQGTSTNSNAVAGNVGQYVDGGLVSAVSFVTSGTYQAMTSISLTAGDWDVSFSAQIFPTTLTSFLIGGLTTVVATPATVGSGQFYSSNGAGGYASGAAVTFSGQLRFSLSSTTTVYLSGAATYTSTAPAYYCQMTARRVR